jgi:phosphoribosylaminoimidazole-succinocarboxamide synthase
MPAAANVAVIPCYSPAMASATTNTPPALYESHLSSLRLIKRGKVRDIYAVDEGRLLVVASDRLSAFDVVLPQPIPGKGEVLTRVSSFWFARTATIVPNHLTGIDPAEVLADPGERSLLGDRAVVVHRLRPLPVEAIVRGYLIGSGWRDYQRSGKVCGIRLPSGLRQADRLPEAIYTPSTKAAVGDHDENVSFQQTAALIGSELAEQVRAVSLRVYREAADYAETRGIIIADTKLELGVDDTGRLHLIDELLTPDSSRFWPADRYRPGCSPPSFDKQFVRDYLETLDWDKTPPGPELPQEIIDKTAAKYAEAETRLTGPAPSADASSD